jgi:hypothetical protein
VAVEAVLSDQRTESDQESLEMIRRAQSMSPTGRWWELMKRLRRILLVATHVAALEDSESVGGLQAWSEEMPRVIEPTPLTNLVTEAPSREAPSEAFGMSK